MDVINRVVITYKEGRPEAWGMQRDTMLEIAPHVLQMCAPLVQAGANHYFTSQQMEKRKEHEIELAERRAEGLQRMSAMAGTANTAAQVGQAGAAVGAAAGAAGAAANDSRKDVYDRLEEMRRDTDCAFCQKAIDKLKTEPEPVAQQGAAELRQYLEKARELRQASASQEVVEREMSTLTGQWEVIPDVMAGSI